MSGQFIFLKGPLPPNPCSKGGCLHKIDSLLVAGGVSNRIVNEALRWSQWSIDCNRYGKLDSDQRNCIHEGTIYDNDLSKIPPFDKGGYGDRNPKP